MCPRGGVNFDPRGKIWTTLVEDQSSRWCYIQNMKALGLVVSDKKFFKNCILKTYFLTLWPTYATNWNYFNNFGRGPPRDHSCEVWSKSNERFQRRRCLSKIVYARRTTDDGRRTTTDDGQRPITIAHPEHKVLRWAKKSTKNYSVIKVPNC